MPYAVVPELEDDHRRALAERRWALLEAGRTDVQAAVALQRQLIGTVLNLTETLERLPPPRLTLPPRYVTTKLGSGIPALVGEPVSVPTDLLGRPLLELARALAPTGEAARLVHAALVEGRLDVSALLTLAVRREQATLHAVAGRLGLGHDLVWLVADLAAGPFVHMILRKLFDEPPAGTPLRTGLDAWSHGYCPLCGSWPSFIEDLNGTRRLRCSFCAAAWELPTRDCIYCGTGDDRFAVVTPDASRPRRAIETCGACRGYAKVTPADDSLPFPLLPLGDFESMDLDMAAMRSGCGRPAAKAFTGRH
jgi:FdhE protein